MMTNCKNCGAPLRGLRCEYCGTEYGIGAGFSPSAEYTRHAPVEIKLQTEGIARVLSQFEVQKIFTRKELRDILEIERPKHLGTLFTR